MLNVNKEKCIGCGICAIVSPEKFQIGLDGKAEAVSQQADDTAVNAAKNCPVGAINAEK